MIKHTRHLVYSINSKLLVPLVSTFVLAIGLFYAVVQYRTQDLVSQRLLNRAFELAESFAVATEINSAQSNLVRVVNSIGAYKDINVLFLLDDRQSVVVASSKNRYTNQLISMLSEQDLKNRLAKAVNVQRNQFLDESDGRNYFVYKINTLAADKASMRTMTLFIDIDTYSSEAYIDSINFYFFGTLLVLLSLVALLSFLFIRHIVLAPIYQLVDAIKRTKSLNKPVVSNYQSSDQLGLLTKVYNELILDSFAKQRELSKEREKSEVALQAKSQFLAMMTHELRTPLNGVIGMSEKLAELVIDSKQKQYLKVVQLSANQLLGTINDTLDFSKIEADRLSLDTQPFDLLETVHNVVAMFELPLQQKEVALGCHLPDDKIPLLDGDSVRISQVVINLLGNAVKFTERGGIDVTVKVHCEQHDTVSFTISVRDSGIGLSPQQIDSLFKEFSQADSSTTRKYGGTGLGLWISKKLTNKMGGEISVVSTLGKGAEFIIEMTLPVSHIPDINQPKIELSKQPDDYVTTELNILLVEDIEINRMVVMAMLEQPNFHIAVAENGCEAVNLFQQTEYDLILMDCLMPIMDGFTASSKIREIERSEHRHKKIPIIALTANALDDTRQQCLDAGMDDFLTKPLAAELLYKTMKKWVDIAAEDK